MKFGYGTNKGIPAGEHMEPTIDLEKLTATDRDLIVQFTNCLRDLDTIRLIAKPMTPISGTKKRKLWESVERDSAKPIADSIQALRQLSQSTDPDVRQLAEQCLDIDDLAMKQLRRIGRRIKQDLYL
jgi:hypothetical protein